MITSVQKLVRQETFTNRIPFLKSTLTKFVFFDQKNDSTLQEQSNHLNLNNDPFIITKKSEGQCIVFGNSICNNKSLIREDIQTLIATFKNEFNFKTDVNENLSKYRFLDYLHTSMCHF